MVAAQLQNRRVVAVARRVCNYMIMSGPTNRFRYRTVVMDGFDEAMLSLALVDAYPGVRFSGHARNLKEPRLELPGTIPECLGSTVHTYFAAPGWQPAFEYHESFWGGSYGVSNTPRYGLEYRRGDWFWGVPQTSNWAFSLPSPETGQLAFSFEKDSREDREFVRELWKLLDRLLTNAVKGGHWKEYVSVKDCKGGDVWVGAHVMDWCRQDPTRMLDGNRRPCDDWEWPDDEWHRVLRRRVIEKFGADFGGPPAPGKRPPHAVVPFIPR